MITLTKLFSQQYPTKVLEEQGGWSKCVGEELVEFHRRKQAVLVICRDMNTAEAVFNDAKKHLESEMLVSYWRDDTQSLPSGALGPGKVVVSTALASRVAIQ